MKLSQAYIPTLKEIPSDAVIPSHRLMLRAGLIRPLAAGIYSHLPLGWRIMKKVVRIIQEEMDRIGGQELHLPVLNPIELWDETGRNAGFGDEMFRLRDRKDRMMALAPTHEEIICDLARKYIRSYKDMPQIWYQIQTKFRDEPRPRSGVIRSRQFFMKDAYSMDADTAGLDHAYAMHDQAYRNIFTRCGLQFHVVGASSGLMGGSGSQEFMMESEFGEDTLILCDGCDYAANLEVAVSVPEKMTDTARSIEKVHTPGQKTIDEVSAFLKREPKQLMKSLVYMSGDEPCMVLIRGDHALNEAKLQSLTGKAVRPAHPDEVKKLCGADVGFIGPSGLSGHVHIIADLAIEDQHNLATGANENDAHLTGLEIERDFKVDQFADIRNVKSGEKCVSCGGSIRMVNAMELGHIFKLGTRYSESMRATYLDRNGKEKPVIMGSYGIGVERILAAAIEQNHDEKGIVWETALAPYHVHIIPVNNDKEEIAQAAAKLESLLDAAGLEILVDDRNVSAGFKFKDADLLGMPVQIIIGKKYLNEKKIELKIRKTGECTDVSEAEVVNTVQKIISEL